MLKNMKIGKRLIVAFLIAIVISSIAGVFGIVMLTKSDMDYSLALENYGFSQGELGNLGRHFQASRVQNLYVITATNATERAGYLKELATEDAFIDTYMAAVGDRPGTAAEKEAYTQLTTQMQAFRTARDTLFSETERSRNSDANIARYRTEMADSSAAVRATLDLLIEDKSRIGSEMSIGLTAQMNIFRLVMVAIILIAFACAIILATFISRGISIPLAQIELAAAHMAKGDYDVEITHTTRDEIGSLAGSMRKMISAVKAIILDTARGLNEIQNGNFNVAPQVEYVGEFEGIENAIVGIITGLSNTMAQINEASDQVSLGADQVSSGAQALSQGTTEQASSVEELAATINEISQQVKNNADNAVDASNKAAVAGAEVEASNQKMQELIGAMREISSSSQEIGKVIKTIEDIAFQTNILALNAAVEAARAGAAGKGFAVVADEVRNLASKSAQAAKGTTTLIEGAVLAVENGTRLVDDTAASLIAVVEGTQSVATLVNRISSASIEQANSIAQVTQGIDQISAVVQTNSATAEESAAASEELSGQAQMLKTLVGRFRLVRGTGQHTPATRPMQSHEEERFQTQLSYTHTAGKY